MTEQSSPHGEVFEHYRLECRRLTGRVNELEGIRALMRRDAVRLGTIAVVAVLGLVAMLTCNFMHRATDGYTFRVGDGTYGVASFVAEVHTCSRCGVDTSDGSRCVVMRPDHSYAFDGCTECVVAVVDSTATPESTWRHRETIPYSWGNHPIKRTWEKLFPVWPKPGHEGCIQGCLRWILHSDRDGHSSLEELARATGAIRFSVDMSARGESRRRICLVTDSAGQASTAVDFRFVEHPPNDGRADLEACCTSEGLLLDFEVCHTDIWIDSSGNAVDATTDHFFDKSFGK